MHVCVDALEPPYIYFDKNSWTLRGTKEAGFVDKAEFEKVKRNGDIAIKNWIDNQLIGTSFPT
ncbi:hypothetical protein EfmAA242_06580 [Enterococcus faecium]|nr:hypothetical protein EfmAA242_06580 [Enterococcus faecium]